MAPRIYNPWFEANGIDAVVVPMGVRAEDYAAFLPSLFRLSNIHGALVTMPHKTTTPGLIDEVSEPTRLAGACNAILKRPDGTTFGDLFDGEGFTRALEQTGSNSKAPLATWWARAEWVRRLRSRWLDVASRAFA